MEQTHAPRLRPARRPCGLGRLAPPARRRLQRQPVRHAFGDELQQLGGGVGAHVRVDGRLGLSSAARGLVDDRQAGREARSPRRVDVAADFGGETDDRLQRFGMAGPAPLLAVGDAMGRGDGHEPPSGAQQPVGGSQVLEIGVGIDRPAGGPSRKRRVHDHHARVGLQQVADVLAVEPRDGDLGEEAPEQGGAVVGELVEEQPPLPLRLQPPSGHHGQRSGAGGGLEHEVVGFDARGRGDGVGQAQRRGELLHPDLLFRAEGVRRLQARGPLHMAEPLAETAPEDAASIPEQEERHRALGGVVRLLPGPAAPGVGEPEGIAHRLAQDAAFQALPALQGPEQSPGGLEQQFPGLTRSGRGGLVQQAGGGALLRRHRLSRSLVEGGGRDLAPGR